VVPSSPAADRGDVAAAGVVAGDAHGARPECGALGPGSGPVGGGGGGSHQSRRQRQAGSSWRATAPRADVVVVIVPRRGMSGHVRT
jgi:hypothetical protein